jgi:hypothetical protein
MDCQPCQHETISPKFAQLFQRQGLGMEKPKLGATLMVHFFGKHLMPPE